MTYDQLVKDGFPYTHNWMSAQHGDSQILIAKSKSLTARNDLKRAMEDGTSDQAAKKQK
jgi:hypothetical protein